MSSHKIIRYIVPMQVCIRKYEVDVIKLQTILRMQKNKLKYTNKYISDKLNKPLTLVEHWFRTDKSFSIPDKDIWVQLKELLKIETDEFDISICTFEHRDGRYEKSNRIYDSIGISPIITCASENELFIVY